MKSIITQFGQVVNQDEVKSIDIDVRESSLKIVGNTKVEVNIIFKDSDKFKDSDNITMLEYETSCNNRRNYHIKLAEIIARDLANNNIVDSLAIINKMDRAVLRGEC